jgi:hypothetical protein
MYVRVFKYLNFSIKPNKYHLLLHKKENILTYINLIKASFNLINFITTFSNSSIIYQDGGFFCVL